MLNDFFKKISERVRGGQEPVFAKNLPWTRCSARCCQLHTPQPCKVGFMSEKRPFLWWSPLPKCSSLIPTSHCHTPMAFCPNVTLLQIATTSLSQPQSTPTGFIFHEIRSHCLKPQCHSCLLTCHSLLTKLEPLGIRNLVCCNPWPSVAQRRGSVGASSMGWL